MPLRPPSYVPIQDILAEPLSHSWDDWDPYAILQPADERTVAQLTRVHNRGITAFAIGCAEWVVYRFNAHSDDTMPYQYLEAYWAYVMGIENVDIPVTEHEEWTGLMRGPMNLALMTVMNTVFLSEEGPPAEECGIAEQNALHVLPNKESFFTWRDAVLPRLQSLCPRDEVHPDGFPVAREVLDPNINLALDDLPSLTATFLATLDYDANPYIRSPRTSSE